MPSNASSVQQRKGPVSASNVGCDGRSFTPGSGTSPTVLESHVLRQATLATQTPYERKHSGFSPGDTRILLGQRDFNATLNRPGVRRFASVRQPTSEEQITATSSSGPGNKAWSKICSWGKSTFGKNKGGDSKRANLEHGPTSGCESAELGEDATRGRGTGRTDNTEAGGRRHEGSEAL